MNSVKRSDPRFPSIRVDKGVSIYRRSDSPCWHLNLAIRGHRLRYSLDTRDQIHAISIAKQRSEELLSFKHDIVLSRDPLIEDLANRFYRHLDLRTAPSTRRLNTDNFRRACTFIRNHFKIARPLRLSDFSPDSIELFMKSRLQSGIKPSTVNRDRMTLHSLFQRAARRRLIRLNPVSLVEPLPEILRRIPSTLTPTQVTKLLVEAARPVPHHGRGRKGVGNSRPRTTPIHDLILFATNTGARLGEMRFLEWRDINMASGVINLVSKDNHPLKDREDRGVRANSLVTGMLRRRLAHCGTSNPLVFPSEEGGTLDPRNTLREFKRIAQRVGVPDANFLTLRHTALSNLAQTGIPTFVLREIAGHATVRTTERYYIGYLGGRNWTPPALGIPQLPSHSVTAE